jgi:hypothetical protein
MIVKGHPFHHFLTELANPRSAPQLTSRFVDDLMPQFFGAC